MGTKVVLKDVRVSYPHLFKARGFAGQDPKFSVSIIIPKDHPQVDEVKLAIRQQVEERWPDKAKRPGGLHNPLRDGDTDRPNDEAYQGCFFVNANTTIDQPPVVVDGMKRKVENLSYWNAGDYANISVDFYPFENQAKRGVGVGLRLVQFFRKGEPLGGRGNVIDDVGVVEAADESIFD